MLLENAASQVVPATDTPFLTILEAGCPRSGLWHSQVRGQVSFSGWQMATFSLYPCRMENREEVCPYVDADPVLGGSTSGYNHLPKAPAPDATTLGLGCQPVNFGDR